MRPSYVKRNMSAGKMSENNFMIENWTNLPVEVLKSIISYKLGDPE